MKNKTNRIATVNVIEMVDGRIIGLASYSDTQEGNKEAEALFKELYRENTRGVAFRKADFQLLLDDGAYEDSNGYQLIITNSF